MRKAGLLAFAAALEEGVTGAADAAQSILRDLRMQARHIGARRFDGGQLGALLRIVDRLAAHPVGIPSLLQGGVIQLAAERERLRETGGNAARRFHLVLVGFQIKENLRDGRNRAMQFWSP